MDSGCTATRMLSEQVTHLAEVAPCVVSVKLCHRHTVHAARRDLVAWTRVHSRVVRLIDPELVAVSVCVFSAP